MKYELKQSDNRPEEYLAIAVNDDDRGTVFSALFSGPDAKRRAEEYVAWKNSEQEVTGEQLLKR